VNSNKAFLAACCEVSSSAVRTPAAFNSQRVFPCAAFAAALLVPLAATNPLRAQTTYVPYTFITYAGTGQQSGSTDGTGAGARFGSPFGVAANSAGILYVGDPAQGTIRKIAAGGVVTTLAGLAQTTGHADGVGTAATFNGVSGIALDSAGNIYAADTNNDTIRRIGPDGTVTTYAGTAGTAGSTDGTGAAARFNLPSAVALDAAGNVYVADTGNNTIRKIAAGGVVTTFAGTAGTLGSADGTGAAAQFAGPRGIATDSAGNLYVADTRNDTIRLITPARVVTTLAGAAGQYGSTDATGTAARFGSFFIGPLGVTVDSGGFIYVSDTGNNTIRRIAPGGAVTTLAGVPGTFGFADGTGNSVSFSTPAGITLSSTGLLYVADFDNSTIRQGSTTGAGYLENLSVRSSAGAAAQALIIGFAIAGTGTSGTKQVLIRGIGPTLTKFAVTGVLANPQLYLYSNSTILYSDTNGWGGSAALAATMAQVGAFALAANSLDGVLSVTLPSGTSNNYTAQVVAPTTAGVALGEVYDATPAASQTPTTPRLVNISGRAQVGTGGSIIIAGFAIGGLAPETVLIRGIGPALTALGVSGALANPVLTLYQGTNVLQSNTAWGTAPQSTTTLAAVMAQVGAFSLSPTSADCVILTALPPGSYTAQVSGLNGTTGVALAEVYEVRQ